MAAEQMAAVFWGVVMIDEEQVGMKTILGREIPPSDNLASVINKQAEVPISLPIFYALLPHCSFGLDPGSGGLARYGLLCYIVSRGAAV
jgi:hypothetical protein